MDALKKVQGLIDLWSGIAWLFFLSCIAMVYMNYKGLQNLTTDSTVEGFGALASLAALFSLLLLVIGMVFNMFLLHRLSHNAGILQPDESRMRPHAAWFWYLVPIANLFMPLRALTQIHNSSMDPVGDLKRWPTVLIWVWWACWLIFGFTANVFGKWSTSGFTFAGENAVAGMMAFGSAAICTFLYIRIMRKIANEQMAFRFGKRDMPT